MIQNINIWLKMVIIKKMMNKSLFKIFVIINVLISLICIISDNYLWLLNIQISFISSFIISLATFYSYKKNIHNGIKDKIEQNNENIDSIDNIEDPYDLYSEEVLNNENRAPNAIEIKEAMKPIKQKNLRNLKDTLFTFVSFFRIFAYFLLIIGFFYLNNNNNLHIYSYLFGFLIVPFSSMFIQIKNN